MEYPVKLQKDDNDTILVTSPDFPELVTFGDDREDALSYAVGAFEEAIAARMAYDKDIPTPSKGNPRVRLPVVTAAKVLLYQAMREKGVTKAELTRRMGIPRQQGTRLLNLNHETKLSQLERAFAAIGEDIEISLAA